MVHVRPARGMWRRLGTAALLGAGSSMVACGESRKADSCFPAGTLVATPRGDVPIERLRIGDEVLAYDFGSETVVVSRVTATFEHADRRVGLLRHVDGVVGVTPNHPVYVAQNQGAARGAWVPAGHVQEGDTLLLGDGLLRDGRRVARGRALGFDETVSSRGTVYNLTVAGQHNYFAGDVLVHNKVYGGPPRTCSTWSYPASTRDLPEVCSGQARFGTDADGSQSAVVLTTTADASGHGGAAGAPGGFGGAEGMGGSGPLPTEANSASITIRAADVTCPENAGVTAGSYQLEYEVSTHPYTLEVWAGDAACAATELLISESNVHVPGGVRIMQLPPAPHWTIRLRSLSEEPVSTALWITVLDR